MQGEKVQLIDDRSDKAVPSDCITLEVSKK